jgi:hypothetical protein
MRILLVEPNYYTQYPPLGLLKLSSLYKSQGHEIRFVHGLALVMRFVPDEIKVTSLFTWAWKPVWEAIEFYRALFPKAKISLGGIYASLTPDHARRSGADEVVSGLVREAEDLMPDYDIVPQWHASRQASIVFSNRGCVRTCGFCAVPKLEGKPFKSRPTTRIRHLIHPKHRRVILWDNNILGETHWREVFDERDDPCSPEGCCGGAAMNGKAIERLYQDAIESTREAQGLYGESFGELAMKAAVMLRLAPVKARALWNSDVISPDIGTLAEELKLGVRSRKSVMRKLGIADIEKMIDEIHEDKSTLIP